MQEFIASRRRQMITIGKTETDEEEEDAKKKTKEMSRLSGGEESEEEEQQADDEFILVEPEELRDKWDCETIICTSPLPTHIFTRFPYISQH